VIPVHKGGGGGRVPSSKIKTGCLYLVFLIKKGKIMEILKKNFFKIPPVKFPKNFKKNPPPPPPPTKNFNLSVEDI